MRLQKRFAHLSAGEGGLTSWAAAGARGSQHRAVRPARGRHWGARHRPARCALTRGARCVMRPGKALCDHARGWLEPRQPDRRLAHRAPRLRPQPAAVQSRLPGRREHPGLAIPGGGGRRGLRARVAPPRRERIRCPRSWAASVTIRASRSAIVRSSTKRSESMRSSVSSAMRPQARMGVREAGAPTSKRVLLSDRGRRGCRRLSLDADGAIT